MKFIVGFVILNLLTYVVSTDVNQNEKKEQYDSVFVATNEWQVVKKGQAIPKGLHVRINLETGLTEAKLLEENLNEDKKSALLTINQPEKEEEVNPEHLEIKKATLEEALKNIKNEDLTADDEDAIKRVTKKFKKYEDIKKELEDISLTPKTDVEVLRDLRKRYNEIVSDKNLDTSMKNVQLYNIFEDIEYLVHQIDNANEFVSLDGFKKLIYPNFNSTNSKIKCQVLNILGSSVQNNPKIQIHALETGGMDKLLRLLALETDNDVSSRILYALSSLLRRFPLAQLQFIKSGGLSVFSNLFSSDKLKIHLRIITLLYDLITEQNNAEKYSDTEIDKLKQYKNINLKSRLNWKWCLNFSKTLKNVIETDENDHDSIEKCLNIINLTKGTCLPYYNNTELKNLFNDLNVRYEKLAKTEINDNLKETDVSNHSEYFQKLKNVIGNLVNSLNHKTEL